MPEFTFRLELAPSPEWQTLLDRVAEAAFGRLRKALEELGEESAAMRLDLADMRKEIVRRLPIAAPPLAEHPPRRQFVTWTPERDARGRQMREAGAYDRDILAEINRLPGPPIGSINAVQRHAADFGWPPARHSFKSQQQTATWTPERDAEGQRLWAQGVRSPNVMRALNELPGPPIASPKAVRNRAARQKWPRPGSAPATAPGHTGLMVAPETIDAFLDANPLPPAPEPVPAPEPEPEPEPDPEPPAPPVAGASTRNHGTPVWTPERDALGRALRQAGHAWPDILARLNTLPGVPISGLGALQQRAYLHGWKAPPKTQPDTPPAPVAPPLPIPVDTGRPALAQQVVVGRDGLPSVAAQMERDALRSTRLNPVSWQTVREWAANQKLLGMPDAYSPKALLAVNKLRASHLLPPFHVVRA
ncbi:MAG: hypothetical protein M0Z28_27485 [Rhodospirillales bacterium]|nr:hypothetical protein [Rhodospirillales bacterium]